MKMKKLTAKQTEKAIEDLKKAVATFADNGGLSDIVGPGLSLPAINKALAAVVRLEDRLRMIRARIVDPTA